MDNDDDFSVLDIGKDKNLEWAQDTVDPNSEVPDDQPVTYFGTNTYPVSTPSDIPSMDVIREEYGPIPEFKPTELPPTTRTPTMDRSAQEELQRERVFIGMDYDELDSYVSAEILKDLIALIGGDTSGQFRLCVCSPRAAEIGALVRDNYMRKKIDFQNGMYDSCDTWIRYFRKRTPSLPPGIKPPYLENKKVGPSLEVKPAIFSPRKPQPNLDRYVRERPVPPMMSPNFARSPSRVVNPYAPAIQLFSGKKISK